MKTKFTLLAVALLTICAFANTWKASEETPVAAGATLIDDELVTAKTVYETTLKTAAKEIAGEEFTHYIQVRVAAAPTADEPNGTDNGGSTPIILTAKKDLTLKIYYRRQSTSQNEDSGVYASNDGKDLKITNQADLSQLDGTLTIVEETEDFKYAWVTKEYELAEGNTYTIWGRGTTINYYGMTYEALEVPVTPIILNLDSGADITTALNEAVAGVGKAGNITINLASEGNYTVSGSLVAPASLTINGNGATIDASSNNDPFIALSTVPSVEEVNSYFRVDGIKIADVTVNDIKNSIVYDNNTKYCVVDLTIDNSVLKLSTEAVKYESLIAFQQGGVKDVNISNSTVYGNGSVAKYFIRYNNSSRLDRYGFDTSSDFQTMNYQNNTFYKVLAEGGQWGNYNGVGGQVYSKFDVQKNIWVDCGTDIIRRMAGGRFNGNNPMTFAFNTYFNAGEDRSESEASYDNSGNILTTDPGFADADNSDFTISGEQQVANQTGDPRWLPAPEPEDIEISPISGDITEALAIASEGKLVKNITINLASEGNYTVSGSLVAPASLTINGNGATIDASSNNDPFIALSIVPSVEEVNSYFRVDGIKIADVTVNDIKNSIVYDNNTKYCVVDLTIDNSVLKLSTEAVKYESLIAFQQGGVKDVNITNSTVYGNGSVAKYFIRYNNSSRLDRYGFDTSSDFQTMNYQNNTFYKVLAEGGQWGNYNGVGGQVYSKFDVQKNIWVDCGTDIIRRMAGGRFNGNNPMTFAFNTYFNAGEDRSESEASYDNSGNILTTDPGFADADNGDFTISGEQQVANQTGDPRWLPAPEPEDIEISPISGDITEALAIASEGKLVKNITINLASEGNYTVSGSLVAPASLTINGNGATIDASSNNDPFIALSTVPSVEEVNSYFRVDGIKIADVTVNDIKNSIVYDNNTKYCVVDLTIDNSVLKLSTEAVKYESLIAFQQGGVKDVNIINSTVYGNGSVAKYFIRYNNSSRLDRYGFDTSSDFQTMNYQNNTFYKVLAEGGQWGNYNGVGGQVYSKFDVQKNIWVDCGTDIIRRMAGGRFNGNNPMTFAFNTYFNAGEDRSESEASYDNSGNILTTDPGFADADNGDFTISGEQQVANQTGDPRWLVEVVENPFDGKYYIYNVAANKYWGAANDWGTRASLIEHPDYVTLAQISDGVYTMESQVSNGGTSYYFGGDYMDGQPINLTITKAGNGLYTIANAEGQFYGYDGSSSILGKNVPEGNNALWNIISETDMFASLNAATVNAPVDATFLIIDHTFGRNNRNVGAWIVSEDCTNKDLTGGNSQKHSAESYHSTFTISQVLNNVPNGVYSFQAQGFYRQDGSDNDNLAQFFINNETALVPLKTGSENSMADACASFENGLYKINPIYVQVEDGQITVGIKNEMNPNLWVIWDNFELTYYGADASLDEVKNAAIIAELAELRAKATALQGQAEVDAVNNGLVIAMAETAEVTGASTAEEIQAAIEKLTAAIDAAEASISAKNTLAAMKELIDNTNVYTEEAYNEYYGQWVAKYEEGTLTKADAAGLQNPSILTGWHSSITVDNFLLSAWDTNPDFVDAPYYINSWSTEGESDGSNFKVPFFEYWTGDDQSLVERVLTATMTNLPAGVYDITALVRVRIKNGAEGAPIGITLQANEGEAVAVTSGAQVGDSQFYLDTFTAQGEVGEDGVLKIKFNVAADNNISWLSFKNVNYAFNPIATGVDKVNGNVENDTWYNLQGVRVATPTKGVYIKNGKKVVVK